MGARPRESWLALDNQNHEQFGDAMALCQDGSASCVHTGKCTFEGDCFKTQYAAYREAARRIRSLAQEQSVMIRCALIEAADHMETLAQAERSL